jgi:hypothetical protein
MFLIRDIYYSYAVEQEDTWQPEAAKGQTTP